MRNAVFDSTVFIQYPNKYKNLLHKIRDTINKTKDINDNIKPKIRYAIKLLCGPYINIILCIINQYTITAKADIKENVKIMTTPPYIILLFSYLLLLNIFLNSCECLL